MTTDNNSEPAEAAMEQATEETAVEFGRTSTEDGPAAVAAAAEQPAPGAAAREAETPQQTSIIWRHLKKLDYVPKHLRYDPEAPPPFGWPLCLLFAVAGMFTISNLYYNHPILNVLADDFGVSYEAASQVPTLMQAGYALGLVLICPLADIVRRRPLTLAVIFLTAMVWLGLCLTTSFTAFRILSFVTAFTCVTPQLMLPLVAELAPPRRRAMMIAVIFGGLFMGLVFARILSGIATQYTSWRTIYYVGLGLQYALLALLFFTLPDYPSSDRDGTTSYARILYTMVRIAMRQPLLVQTSLVLFFISAAYVGFWTVLTFALSSPPFSLSTLDVGLFALVGVPPFFINPPLAQYLTNHFHAAYATVFGLLLALAGIVVGTFVGTFSLAGPVVMGFCIDLGLILVQTACRMQLVAVEPHARNRVNTVFMVTGFFGMLMGTSVCNRLYAAGGWRYSGYAGIAFVAAALLLCAARGPHETRWFGYRGGWRLKSSLAEDGEGAESELAADAAEGDEKRSDTTATPPDLEGGLIEKSS